MCILSRKKFYICRTFSITSIASAPNLGHSLGQKRNRGLMYQNHLRYRCESQKRYRFRFCAHEMLSLLFRKPVVHGFSFYTRLLSLFENMIAKPTEEHQYAKIRFAEMTGERCCECIRMSTHHERPSQLGTKIKRVRSAMQFATL